MDVLIDLDFRFELRNRGIWGEGAVWGMAEKSPDNSELHTLPPAPLEKMGNRG